MRVAIPPDLHPLVRKALRALKPDPRLSYRPELDDKLLRTPPGFIQIAVARDHTERAGRLLDTFIRTVEGSDVRGRVFFVDDKTMLEVDLGKRVRESTGTTKKAKADMIERARRDQHAFRQRGMVDPEVGKATTFGELIDFWWKNYGTRLKSQTIKGSIEKHLRPALGALPLSSFTGLAMEQLLQSKAAELKPRTRNHLRAVVRRMFKVATRGGLWLGANPIDDVAIAEVPKTVASFLAVDEVGPFLSACHGQYRQIFATALFTGMREGELFGLRKQDVDWSSAEITVRKSWDGETTKSRASSSSRSRGTWRRTSAQRSTHPTRCWSSRGRTARCTAATCT
jgi:hypothetical protein